MGLLSALVLVIVLAVTPSVLFLLFWEFLVYLRDDALIEELRLKHDLDPRQRTPANVFSVARSRPGRDLEAGSCPSCGARTAPNADACLVCGDRLE